MLRSAVNRLAVAGSRAILGRSNGAPMVVAVRNSSESTETDEELDARYIAYFNRKDIDGWEVRKAMTDVLRMDMVPEPPIIIAAMKACRRINDYALTTRFLEACRFKCGPKVNEIFPYIMQEIKPTLDELGISSLEEMGYDKPELACMRFDEI